MTGVSPNSDIDGSVEKIIEALDGLDELPTHDFAEFCEAFYGDLKRGDVADTMFGLVDRLGKPLKPISKRESLLYPDRTQTILSKKFKGYQFSAIATAWGDSEDRFRAVDLRAQTKFIPLVTRKGTRWGLDLRAENVNSEGESVVNPSYDPHEGPHEYDEAFVVSWAIGQRPRGLKTAPHPWRNTVTLTHDPRPWESLQVWTPPETAIDRAIRMSQTSAAKPKAPQATRTPEGVSILQSAEINRRTQLFRDNFLDLSLLLLAATGTAVAIEFVQEQQAENEAEPERLLRLVRPNPSD